MEQQKAFIGMPCYTDACANAFAVKRATLEHGLVGRMPFACEPAVSSSLPYCFNNLWAKGIAGDFDWFFMLHSDIVPERGWAAKLLDIAIAEDADVVSACAPIKSGDGVFSVGVSKPSNRWGAYYRFTAKQLQSMPETFSIKDTDSSDKILIVNTGCWVANLRKPWVREQDEDGALKFCFDMRHRIYVHPGNKHDPQMEPEDWRFSRDLHAAGAKVLATKAVQLFHFGTKSWNSLDVWGEEIDPLADQEYINRLIDERGVWLERLPDGKAYDAGLAKALAEDLAGKTIIDLGCGRGLYVRRFRQLGIDAIGLDGSPRTVDVPDCMVADLSVPVAGIEPRDWAMSIEVGEHIPADYESSYLYNVCQLAKIGVVLSWAPPGQAGHGHVNCRSADWVVAEMMKRGFKKDDEATELLRQRAELDYLKANVLVFRRDGK